MLVGECFSEEFAILVSPRAFITGIALSKPFVSFIHRRTVRLITDPEMEIDALKVVQGLPDFSGEICGIVPVYGGRAFDITLKSTKAAAKLAANGFPYGDEIRPLTLLGVKTVHISVLVSVQYPDEDLIHILKVYGDLKSENLWRLTFKEVGCQRRPNRKTPVKSDSEEETTKKANRDESSGKISTSSPPSTPADKSCKIFVNTMESSAWKRSKLMQIIFGVCYYRCRGLYLQHSPGDH